MTELVKYEAARRALAEAVAVDEVLDVRIKVDAMRHYARQAGDRGLEIQCAQLRFRAERRLGEMLVEQKETIGLNRGRAGAGRPPLGDSDTEQPKPDDRPTLAEVGIDRKLSSKAQRMAAMDAAEFEAALSRHAEEVRAGQGRVAMDLLKVGAEEKGRAHRRDLAAAMSGATIDLPAGRRYPALYVDPPWKREGGMGDRAYENHYPTMSWPDILEVLRQAAKSLLPDAWAFMWIPRAHLLALVEVQRELQVKLTGELVVIEDRIPLAWACCLALGADYSTAFVWTKTDADHPDVSGSGLIARDQDELLLLFKRGHGLPKPSGSEKFGSNHRERPREHSRKPEFYRHMIATMVGRDSAGNPLPVLEMFARVDAEHPLPPGWDACGNQAAPIAVVPDRAEQLFGAPAATRPARSTWPAGHVVAMTNPVVDGRMRTVGSCACGEVFSFPWGEHDAMDAAVEAHWQAIENSVSLVGLPSAGEAVTAAADATDGASPVAAVTDNSAPAFPPTEFVDLKSFECADDARIPAAQVEAIAPEYVRRGLVHSWCGSWRLSPAGVIRLQVLERERVERTALFRARLEQQDFWDWCDLAAIAAGEDLDRGSVRSLVGLDLAGVTDEVVHLTDAGRARLAEIEVMVEGEAVLPVPASTPVQLDLVQMLEGAK